ncbi:MAG: hypothetical protein ACTSVA_02075 [Candidatus Njordarchaeales archaeon]
MIEIPKTNFTSVMLILKERSPIMVEEGMRAFGLVKHYYPDVRNVSAITLKELEEQIKSDRRVREFLKNIVFIYDKKGLLKRAKEMLKQNS